MVCVTDFFVRWKYQNVAKSKAIGVKAKLKYKYQSGIPCFLLSKPLTAKIKETSRLKPSINMVAKLNANPDEFSRVGLSSRAVKTVRFFCG